MTQSNSQCLEAAYSRLQASLPVSFDSGALTSAVNFGTNRSRPVHRWFHFKEGFSADLLSKLGLALPCLSSEESVFLDPFCGSGTTLVAADIENGWKCRRIGYEVNPFIAFVAETKANWRTYNVNDFQAYVGELTRELEANSIPMPDLPALSVFHNPSMVDMSRVRLLLGLVRRINQIDAPERAPLLLGVASAVEKLSYYRKDGRALRILRNPSERAERELLDSTAVIRQCWEMMVEDLRSLEDLVLGEPTRSANVIVGDGRRISSTSGICLEPGNVNLMAYSPPYLNHIDYTEVYKVELWLLDFIDTQPQMLQLRRETLRSHGSVKVEQHQLNTSEDVAIALELASDGVLASSTSWHRSFPSLLNAYLYDMQLSFTRQLELLEPGGRAACVVGNSAHGVASKKVTIAIDLILAHLGQEIGFQVEKLIVARPLSRRVSMSKFMRESIIIFRRPS